MTSTARIGDEELSQRASGGRHEMNLLGSHIIAETRPWREELWIRATTSEQLNHPYLENWLSEPMRALRGQLIFPRLVARNFADGRSMVWVRSAPALTRGLGGCASQLRNSSASEFWSFYAAYLTYVAACRDANGNPGFEANELTRLHDEVIQACMAGSRWVIALCVASAIEGLAKLDPSFLSVAPEFSEMEIEGAKGILAGIQSSHLRDRLSRLLPSLAQPSASQHLGQLQAQGHISQTQLHAWRKVRNRVAHGNLNEPWGTPEERERLVHLVELFYRLTALRIGYWSAAA